MSGSIHLEWKSKKENQQKTTEIYQQRRWYVGALHMYPVLFSQCVDVILRPTPAQRHVYSWQILLTPTEG